MHFGRGRPRQRNAVYVKRFDALININFKMFTILPCLGDTAKVA